MKRLFTILLAASVLNGCGGSDDARRIELVMYCAAGMKQAVAKIARQYQEEYGVAVRLQYGGSGTLLSMLKVTPKGDIYLAADSSYIKSGIEMGLVAETIPVAFMRAGIGVPKGNPKGITSLEQLASKDLRVGFANPEAASIGKFTKKILSEAGLWERVEPIVLMPTVNELANTLKLGTTDAVILWDAIAHQYPEIDFVAVPEFDSKKMDVTVGVLAGSENATQALRFCRYLSARDRGLKAFEANGYEIVEGDAWAEKPEILFFSGSMLRPAIEDSVKKFETREGVTITPIYNGCGILVSQMKSGEQPDAYFSCDIEFMEMVADRFLEPTIVSANEMVILVGKDNPENILTLADLAAPGMRIGLSHPEKSALGFLTKSLLEGAGIYQKIINSGNLRIDSPTGDFLVNQIKTGSLDAVIVYKSNAMASASTADDVEIIGIDRPEAVAYQAYAVAKNSQHKQLLERFFKSTVSATGKENFLRHGFRWELQQL